MDQKKNLRNGGFILVEGYRDGIDLNGTQLRPFLSPLARPSELQGPREDPKTILWDTRFTNNFAPILLRRGKRCKDGILRLSPKVAEGNP